jgi:hypothetical protein
MSQAKLPTDVFRARLTDQVKHVCAERGWSYDNNSHRGSAFQFWLAELFCRREGIDASPEEGVFLNNDCGIDIIIEDQNQKRYCLIQAKFVRFSTAVEESEVSHLCDRHGLFRDRNWVRKHTKDDAQFETLGSYEDLLRSGYSMHYYFVTTGTASDRVKDLATVRQTEINREDPSISFDILDFAALKEFFIEAETLEQSIPEHVEFQLPQGSFTIKERPYKTLLAVIKGNALVNLYKKERERLFSYNIRSYLGRKGLNKDIIQTAEMEPSSFYYFNNGVSAICTSFDVDDFNIFHAQNFQIINGAQTVGALSAARLNSDIEVLLRVTEGLSVKTDRGFNADIIKFNNTQNVVKSSDFRANDKIQIWLENKFKTLRHRGAITKITYVRKRTNRKTPGMYVLRLEDFAKIIHTFNFEPTRSVADPKSLWTMQADGGFYEEAFGSGGELVSFWEEVEFERSLLAITLYKSIEDRISEVVKRDKSYVYLRRLRFFALALARVYIDIRYADKSSSDVLSSEIGFRKLFDEFWSASLRELIEVHHRATEEDKISGFALVRNEQRWRSVKERFSRYLKVMP